MECSVLSSQLLRKGVWAPGVMRKEFCSAGAGSAMLEELQCSFHRRSHGMGRQQPLWVRTHCLLILCTLSFEPIKYSDTQTYNILSAEKQVTCKAMQRTLSQPLQELPRTLDLRDPFLRKKNQVDNLGVLSILETGYLSMSPGHIWCYFIFFCPSPLEEYISLPHSLLMRLPKSPEIWQLDILEARSCQGLNRGLLGPNWM